jgi:threonine aldolase
MKQHGALLAKGRILGAQFLGLFQNDLFFDLARHANAMAEKLSDGISALGFSFLNPPVSNQIFPVLPNQLIFELHKHYGFYIWKRTDESNSAVRMVASWATQEKHIEMFLDDLKLLFTK